jgi:hypothetical protein
MRGFRFHIGSLVILILIIGVGFAALRESNDLWDSVLFTVTIGVLLISVLLSVHRTESRRAFCIGFAVFGWIYLGLASVPSIESRLITTKALAFLDSKVPGRSSAVYTIQIAGTGSGTPSNQVPNMAFTTAGGQKTVRVTGRLLGGWSGSTANFVRIGHSLFALLAAWLGGQLSRRLFRSLRSPVPTSATEVEGAAQ